MLDSIYFPLLVAVLSAFIISYIATPFVKKLAHKIGAIDIPKDNRRMHKKPIPLIGGLAIFLGFSVSCVLSRILLVSSFRAQFLPIWIGALLIVILGIFDDIYALNPWVKLIGQIVIAMIPVMRGITITHIFSIPIGSKILAGAITVFWIVALTNAVNLIDGLDGLACGVSTICCITLMIVSMLHSETYVTIFTAALVGANLGFLPYNSNPASIFMGDTGSMFLGYTLSLVSIVGVFKLTAAISFVIPIIIFGLPLFDTAFAIIRRLLQGRSPFSADRGHLHHRLVDHGFNVKQSVLILYALTSILGILAIMITENKFESIAIIIGIAVFIGVFNKILAVTSRKEEASGEDEMKENDEKEKKTEDKPK